MSQRSSKRFLAITILAIVAAALTYPQLISRHRSGQNQLVLYCACDAAIAEPVISKFVEQSGIQVEVRFDEEANKSLGLANLLIAEKENPRCDVYWNNQALGTARLKSEGVLQAYLSPNAERIPEGFKDTENCWTGFSARLRVYLFNTDHVVPKDETAANLIGAESLKRIAIAQPLFGTTLSHYAVVAGEVGMDGLKSWHRSMHDRGIRQVRGNSMTRDLVAEGICDLGFTDTDDAFGAIDKGHPVEMLPVRLIGGQTICIPNTVAMVAECPNPEAAREFIDFLLSEEVEMMLAAESARQIPLGQVNEEALSEEVLQLKSWAQEAVDLDRAAAVHQEVLDWLSSEYSRS